MSEPGDELCLEKRQFVAGREVIRTEYCIASVGHSGPCWFELFAGDPGAAAEVEQEKPQ